MIKTLHGLSVYYSNVLTQARIARDTGYEAMEFLSDHLLRYLDNGGTAEKLKSILDDYGLKTGCINAIVGIERQGDEKVEMLKTAERLTIAARDLECPTIQLLVQHGLDGEPEDKVMDLMTENIGAIADIGLKYGVRYQIEVVAHTNFNSLSQGLEVIKRLDKGNLGFVIDFWHLYATGKTTPEDIANLDPSLIYGVHFCDGRKPYENEPWDESIQRAYMPGDGEIDIQAYTDAVKKTGFDGVWSAELFHPDYWEYDSFEAAKICLENMMKYVKE